VESFDHLGQNPLILHVYGADLAGIPNTCAALCWSGLQTLAVLLPRSAVLDRLTHLASRHAVDVFSVAGGAVVLRGGGGGGDEEC
jgi:hypothetical protein